MRVLCRMIVFGVLFGLWMAGTATAANSTNSWNNISGGNFTNDANWDTGTAPSTTTDWVYYTNSQATAYTVTFTSSRTTGPLNIIDDSVTFDMGGFRWDTPAGDSFIGTNNGAASTVTFSSSSATNVLNGNVVVLGGGSPGAVPSLGNTMTFVVDDSLGFPVRVEWAGGLRAINGPIVVSGTNSEFRLVFPNSFLGTPSGGVLVTNQAILSWGGGNQPHALLNTTRVVNAYLRNPTAVATAGYLGRNSGAQNAIILTEGSEWYDAIPFNVGFTGPGRGHVTLDNSTYIGQTMTLGDGSGNGTSSLRIQNGSSATFSNRLVITGWSSHTNTLVLNNGTINLGGGAIAGVLSNQSVMRTAGTIRGIGNSPALVYVGSAGAGALSSLEIGGSIGTLTLSNANLEVGPGAQLLLEFSDTALDQILISGGGATLLGSNVFTLASGSAPLAPGFKWGLGTYDFIVGTNVTWNPQYDNLTNLLASAGLVQGLDYEFGLADLDGGLQALRLQFIPEPSTLLLLLGGGVVLWRYRRRG